MSKEYRPSAEKARKNIVVIGGGLSGLITAIKLQQAGANVTVVEKNKRLGGLCGTFDIDGHEYVIGCNDFGQGMAKVFSSLGVDQKFVSLESKVFYNGRFYDAQIGVNTLWELRSDWKNMFNLMCGLVVRVFSKKSIKLETFVDRWTSPGLVNDYAKLVSYFMGVSPCELSTSFFSLENKFNYGYTKMICPVGGPQVMVDALRNKFQEKKGALKINTEVLDFNEKNGCACILAKDSINGSAVSFGNIDHIVNAAGAEDLYPKETKQGMPLSSLCIEVSEKFNYPENVHTITYYPEGVSKWFTLLDEGERPTEFGFHVFNSRLAKYYHDGTLKSDSYTLNVFFYTPRNVTTIPAHTALWYQDYIYERLEKMLPGIKHSILSSRVIDPKKFKDLHGVSSSVMPFISDAEKPKNRQGEFIHYAGHHVYPPGDHAGASVTSGLIVANDINT